MLLPFGILNFEQEAPQFHFSLGPANGRARSDGKRDEESLTKEFFFFFFSFSWSTARMHQKNTENMPFNKL